MKTNPLNNLNVSELQANLAKEQAALAKLHFDLADRKLKRTSDLPKTRKTIARIKTALNKKS